MLLCMSPYLFLEGEERLYIKGVRGYGFTTCNWSTSSIFALCLFNALEMILLIDPTSEHPLTLEGIGSENTCKH